MNELGHKKKMVGREHTRNAENAKTYDCGTL